MDDILLTSEGDLEVGLDGDIKLTTSLNQAIRVRLQWFLGEWRLAPQYGLPYYGSIFTKRPDLAFIRRAFREEVLNIPVVTDVRDMKLVIDAEKRKLTVTMEVVTTEGVYREEVELFA